MRISKNEENELIALYLDGYSVLYIAKRLAITQSHVRFYLMKSASPWVLNILLLELQASYKKSTTLISKEKWRIISEHCVFRLAACQPSRRNRPAIRYSSSTRRSE
jgi:hypothetical protein